LTFDVLDHDGNFDGTFKDFAMFWDFVEIWDLLGLWE
jgi:hypothetical protein